MALKSRWHEDRKHPQKNYHVNRLPKYNLEQVKRMKKKTDCIIEIEWALRTTEEIFFDDDLCEQFLAQYKQYKDRAVYKIGDIENVLE